MPALKNARHEAFAQAISGGMSAGAAYRAAGYRASDKAAETAGPRLFRNVQVKARVEEIQGKAATRVEIDKAWVLNNLKIVAERCMQAVPVLDRKGDPVFVETPTGDVAPAYTFQPMGANKALELIGKDIGMFKEIHELTGKDGKPIEYRNLSADAVRDELADVFGDTADKPTDGDPVVH